MDMFQPIRTHRHTVVEQPNFFSMTINGRTQMGPHKSFTEPAFRKAPFNVIVLLRLVLVGRREFAVTQYTVPTLQVQ